MEHSKADVAKLFLERFKAHRASSHQPSMAEAVELLTNAQPPRLPWPIRKAEASASRTTSVTSFSDSFEPGDSGPSAAAAPSPSSSNGNSGEGQPATPTGESLDSDEGGGGGDSEGGGGGDSEGDEGGDSEGGGGGDSEGGGSSDDAGRRVVQRVAEAPIDDVRHLSDTKLHLEVVGSWKLLITSKFDSSHRLLPTACSACEIRLEWGSDGNVAGAHVTWVDGPHR